MGTHRAAITLFGLALALISIIGFLAARWKMSELATLDEWGLAGRRFGTVLSWFLIGGDLYTAYTFIAIPALVYGTGAMGFFGVPYTTILYPLIFMIVPRLWSVCHDNGYITAADFVRGTFGSRPLALAIAGTGIIATMPYIALQLIGIQVVVAALGFPIDGLAGKIPLAFALITVAAYTYTSGLRAPAMIAVAKDILIYITIIAAILIIPAKLGGFARIFAQIPASHLLLTPPSATSFGGASAYGSLALGSAVALILYPHSLTAMFSAQSCSTIRRNTVLLPAYSLLLGFLALLGFMANVAHVDTNPLYAPFFAKYHASFAVPALFLSFFPDWFVGIAFAAIAIGAVVPAAIMAIAAANLYTRSIHPEFQRKKHTDSLTITNQKETHVARLASLGVLGGALLFMLLLPTTYAVQFQLLGGIWIIQTAPAILFGLFSGWYEARGLFWGWLIGMALGTVLAALQGFTPLVTLSLGTRGIPLYIALVALCANLLGATIISACNQHAIARSRSQENSWGR